MNSREYYIYQSLLSKLSESEIEKRDVYLHDLANGTIKGPQTGIPSIDKPWLGLYSVDDILDRIPQKTIYQYLKDCHSGWENEPIIEYFGKKIKSREVFTQVDWVANTLSADYRIGKGDIVSLCMPTIPETYYLFLALNKLGAIANMIDPRINEERIHDSIGTESKIVFVVDVFLEKICSAATPYAIPVVSISAASSLNPIMRFIYNCRQKKTKEKKYISWSRFLNNAKELPNVSATAYEKNTPAAIVYTSGTTGVPKGVILSNENINYIACSFKKFFSQVEDGERYLVIMPPFIAYGLVCGICCPMVARQKMILVPNFNPKELDRLIAKYKPNHMMGVPAFFEAF